MRRAAMPQTPFFSHERPINSSPGYRPHYQDQLCLGANYRVRFLAINQVKLCLSANDSDPFCFFPRRSGEERNRVTARKCDKDCFTSNRIPRLLTSSHCYCGGEGRDEENIALLRPLYLLPPDSGGRSRGLEIRPWNREKRARLYVSNLFTLYVNPFLSHSSSPPTGQRNISAMDLLFIRQKHCHSERFTPLL